MEPIFGVTKRVIFVSTDILLYEDFDSSFSVTRKSIDERKIGILIKSYNLLHSLLVVRVVNYIEWNDSFVSLAFLIFHASFILFKMLFMPPFTVALLLILSENLIRICPSANV